MKKQVRFAHLLASLLLATLCAVSAKAQVTNVTQTTTHLTLQDAIDNANLNDELRVDVNLNEGLIVVNETVRIFGNTGTETINSSSPNHGIRIEADGVEITDLTLDGAGTFGIITAPGYTGFSCNGVTVANCGGTGFAITCVSNVMLTNITGNSNGGNAVSITDCNNVVIDGITTDGNNQFPFLPFSGAIGIYASGIFCAGGVDGVTIQGNVQINDFVALFEQVTGAGSIDNIWYTPDPASMPQELPFVVGDTEDNKAYVATLAEAFECAASLFAAGLSSKENVFIREILTGNMFVGANLNPLPSNPMFPYPFPGPKTMCITPANTYLPLGACDTIFVQEGDYYEEVVLTKPCVVLGPNAAMDPCTNTPAQAAQIFPTEVGSYDGGGNTALIRVESNGVSIQGLTLNGDNPSVTSGNVANSADIDADFGIVFTAPFSDFEVKNNFILNVDKNGIRVLNGASNGASDCSFTPNITDNQIFNVPGTTGSGSAIFINSNVNVSIVSNCVDAAVTGLQFANGGQGSATDNVFSGVSPNDVDVLVSNGAGASVNLNGKNTFLGSSFGVRVGASYPSGPVDATNNWWGDISGPSGEGAGMGSAVSPNVDFCPWLDDAPPSGMPVPSCDLVVISGRVIWEEDLTSGVQKVQIQLTGDQMDLTTTGTNGEYDFAFGSGTNFLLTPIDKLLNPIPADKFNGVDAADATRIQQHIAGILPFTSPYDIIAADVNKSNSVTTADAAIIFQATLGNPIAEGLFCCAWRYTPLSYMFPNPSVPWGFPEDLAVTVTPFVPSIDNDFVGMKVGDVTGNADPALRPANLGDPLVLRMADQALVAGEEVRIPVRIEGFNDIAALQYMLEFDESALSFEGIEHEAISPFTKDNFGLFQIDEGQIRSAMALVEGLTYADGMQHYTLRFVALRGGVQLSEVLSLNTDELNPRAYSSDLAPHPIEVVFATTTSTTGAVAQELMLVAQPNPAHGSTNIRFNMPAAGEASIRLMDATGRVITETNGYFQAGPNVEVISFGNATGLIIAELQTAEGRRTVKIIAE